MQKYYEYCLSHKIKDKISNDNGAIISSAQEIKKNKRNSGVDEGIMPATLIFQYLMFQFRRKNPELAQELRFNDIESVRTSNFDPAKLTKIIIHGYADGVSEVQIGTWIVEMRDAYLQLADVNYIAVDFAPLASFFLYFTAVPEMVGERLGEMIAFLHEKHALPLDPLHLVGWSWGRVSHKDIKKLIKYFLSIIVAFNESLFKSRCSNRGFCRT